MTPSGNKTSDPIHRASEALEDAVYLLDNVPESFAAASCTLLPPPDPSAGASQPDATASAQPRSER